MDLVDLDRELRQSAAPGGEVSLYVSLDLYSIVQYTSVWTWPTLLKRPTPATRGTLSWDQLKINWQGFYFTVLECYLTLGENLLLLHECYTVDLCLLAGDTVSPAIILGNPKLFLHSLINSQKCFTILSVVRTLISVAQCRHQEVSCKLIKECDSLKIL